MQIAVVAHVRGNKAALDAVLEAIDALEPAPDRVVIAGETEGDGPDGKRVRKRLAKRGLSSGESSPELASGGGEQYLINGGSAGYPNAGDPRATFALVRTQDGEPPVVEHVRVPYALKKTVRSMLRRADRGQVEPKQALEYLRGLLGDKELITGDPPLSGAMKGADLTVALLATRIHRVYGIASLDWPDDDVEHVHDLRVATRRLREALALAAPLFRRKKVAQINRRARDFGRALGERRIYDVFLEDVRKLAREHNFGLASFLTFLEARRDRATIEICLNYSKRKLSRHGLEFLELSMRPKDQETTLASLAVPSLEAHIAELESRAPCIDDPAAHDAHHELRIKLKHLRYAAEILRSAWPAVIAPEETVAPIKEMQDALGELNDARELIHLAREHGGGGVEIEQFTGAIESTRAARFEKATLEVKNKLPSLLAKMREIAGAIRA